MMMTYKHRVLGLVCWLVATPIEWFTGTTLFERIVLRATVFDLEELGN
jgi:hypothetical protein